MEAGLKSKTIKIKGEKNMVAKRKYRCSVCGLEWSSPEKEYKKCPECDSEKIVLLADQPGTENVTPMPGLGRRRGGGRMGTGAPRVCKCIQCGYEAPKTPGIPCRNEKCPECGGLLCGSD